MKRAYVAVAATVGIFLLVQLGALALVEPFMDAGYQTVEDPSDPTNSVLYIGAILVATAVMLVALKFGVDQLLQGLIVFASVFLSFYVFSVVIPAVVTVGSLNVLAVGAALLLGVGLLAYPEWYVIDAAGIVMGAGAAGLFGISFGLLPALVLLVVLAVYDAISVYGTEHMLTLASGVMDLRLPVVLVIPLTLSYSFLEEEGPETISDDDAGETSEAESDDTEGATEEEEEPPEPFERDAFFIGLGDAVIPSILVASAAFFRPGDAPLLDVPGLAVTVPALGAVLGTTVGLLVLMWMVMKGRAHAGLPLLNGGAIAGYLLGALVAGIALVDAVGLAPYL
ncbi:presenilin family intramembrane aspartyl protease PSH [Natronomonas gomsonensis]|uniref:presenilin family intramembrane aspartyl protease PSH n=1 Tax=Natronomonas gomsonensis TaxID=1046043 RepID=UPI0015BF32DE|nr:presenilin family intramembrane aspartyl protease PSH [Natronomonas gomsonensis]